MAIVYPVVFTETKDGTVLVYIPDLDGMTEGHGVADAIAMAKDYIGNALFDREPSGIPHPSEIGDVDIAESPFAESGKTFVSLVDTDLDAFRARLKTKSVRRNITLPEWLDDMATRAKLNVSQIAQSALRKELGVS